jgi:hypothetical protein
VNDTVGFLLSLQTLDERPDAQRHAELASTYSLTLCLSTTSTLVC